MKIAHFLLIAAIAVPAIAAPTAALRTAPLTPERVAELVKLLGKRLDPAAAKISASVANPVNVDANLTFQVITLYEASTNYVDTGVNGSLIFSYRYKNNVDYVADCTIVGTGTILVGSSTTTPVTLTDNHALIIQPALKTGGGGFRSIFLSPSPGTAMTFRSCEIRVVS